MHIPFFTEETLNEIREQIQRDRVDVPTTAIVIDVETLGKANTSIVFNLAALFFSLDPNAQPGVEELFPNNAIQFRFDPLEQIALGRTTDLSTLEFWRSEKQKAAMAEIQTLSITPLREGMEELRQWVEGFKELYNCRVYYRGTDFDRPILDSLYESAGVKVEWKRGDAPRDIRTYIDAKLDLHYGYIYGIPKSEREISHTALGDCYNDARQMQIAYLMSNERCK